MGELRIHSVLVTGANRGIGLGLVRHFLGMPNPPKWVFAACRDPKGQRAQVRLGWDAVGCAGGRERSVPGQQVGAGRGFAKGSSCSRAPAAQGSRAGTAVGPAMRGMCSGHGAPRGQKWQLAASHLLKGCRQRACVCPDRPGHEAVGHGVLGGIPWERGSRSRVLGVRRRRDGAGGARALPGKG